MIDLRTVRAVRIRLDSHALAGFEAVNALDHDCDRAPVIEANHELVAQIGLNPKLKGFLEGVDITFNAHNANGLNRAKGRVLKSVEIELPRRVGRGAGGKACREAQDGEECFGHGSVLVICRYRIGCRAVACRFTVRHAQVSN
jgi:hypothetical protein